MPGFSGAAPVLLVVGMRANLSTLMIGLLIAGCGGCILPVPHTRVHAFGVRGQIVSADTHEPVAGAWVTSTDQLSEPAHCDEAGRFRLHPKRGWHAAYCIGPIRESLWPGWDVTYPGRVVRISAPGYSTMDLVVSTHAKTNSGLSSVKACSSSWAESDA